MITPHILDKKAVRADLEEAADKVKASDKYAADRLYELANAVDSGSYSDAWAATDIHRVIDVPAIVQYFRDHGRKEGIVVWIESIRNVFIFAPLVVTWFGISGAVSAYGDLVQADERKSALPFILLWQQGFDGRLSWIQSFATVAWLDFSILSGVLLLTACAVYFSALSRQRREEEANKLEKLLLHGLAGARLCLTTKNWSQPTNFVTRFDEAIESFKQVVGELVKQMQAERSEIARLAERQQEETRLFSTFKTELRSSMTGISSAVTKLQSTISSLTTATGNLQNDVNVITEPIKQVAQQQVAMTANTQRAITLLDSQIKAQTNITQQQESWGKTLQQSLQTLETTVQKNTQQANDFGETIQELQKQYIDYLNKIKEEHGEQKELSNRIYDAADRMGKTVQLLSEWNNEISGVNVNMHEIVRRLAGMAPSKP